MTSGSGLSALSATRLDRSKNRTEISTAQAEANRHKEAGWHPIRNRFATEKIKNNEPESFSSMQKRKSQNGNGNENVPKQCRATKGPNRDLPVGLGVARDEGLK